MFDVFFTLVNLISHPYLHSGTPEQGCIQGALPHLPFERRGNGGTGVLTWQNH